MADAEPAEPPPEPQNLTARVNGDGYIVLSWEALDDDSVAGFQILRRRPTIGEDTLLVYVEDTGSTATTYTDMNVTAEVRHVYRVKAINSAGVGPQSNYVNPMPQGPGSDSVGPTREACIPDGPCQAAYLARTGCAQPRG